MASGYSSDYETSYSTDERIEHELKLEREEEIRLKLAVELKRQILFKSLRADKNAPVFKLVGLSFLAFRHSKIKFRFEPHALTRFIREGLKFYVSLKFRGLNWLVKRDTLPVFLKQKVYSLFYDENGFAVDDENVLELITRIYRILCKWCEEEQNYRTEKFQRYRRGELDDLDLDSDDEMIFLTLEERVARYHKLGKILKRMMIPKGYPY